MNVLALVFSLLLILSYGFYACWEGQLASARLRKTYLGHEKVNRKILNQYESEFYNHHLKKGKGAAVESPSDESSSDSDEEGPAQESTPKPIPPNPECAKLNLWPLIQEGRESHPILYDLVIKLIRTFYGAFECDERSLLNELLAAAKRTLQTQAPFALEKLDLDDPDLQRLYYKMLRGTKKWDLASGVGYPPFLEYVKAAPLEGKTCLFHAHPDLIAALFNQKFAFRLHEEIHQKKGTALTGEFLQTLCRELHQLSIDPKFLELFQLGHPFHHDLKKSFLAEDAATDISLRKSVYIKS